jgi:DNA topoisomerase-1
MDINLVGYVKTKMPTTNLVIVESAAKSKTIAKYLNNSKELKSLGHFQVVASFGHVRDLAKGELGILINKGFEPVYEVIEDKNKLVEELKKKAKAADHVYLASDPDREGESISLHLKQVLGLTDYKRISFTEITKNALEYAVQHPRSIDMQLVDAQETRRVLDRLVGFKLSPLLWKRYTTANTSTLSAGRVQSAVLHMIIEKEKQIQTFETSPYWNISGTFSLTIGKDKDVLKDIKLYKGSTIHKVTESDEVLKFFKKIKNKFTITKVQSKTSRQSPDLPFITSSMQQEAYSKLGMSLKRSMQIAQELYENGYITYMRTDSHSMSDDFKTSARKFIHNTYGESYYEGGTTHRKKNVKGAQEAHECIRVTEPSLIDLEDTKMTKDHKGLYSMIWKRTIASLLKSAVYDELEIKIVDVSMNDDMYFLSVFKKLKYNGYLIVYGVQSESYDFNRYLSELNKGDYGLTCSSLCSKNVWATPPARYNESTMVKTLEAEGLGRPSTYSTILSKLFDRRYIIKTSVTGIKKDTLHFTFDPNHKTIKKEQGEIDVGGETGKIVPTDIGMEIDLFLEQQFDYIVDKQFTALMENDLDAIAHGEKAKIDVLNTFWKRFHVDLMKHEAKPKEKKIALKTQDHMVVMDGKTYVVRIAKFGPVIQYDHDDNSKKYINLKPYLTIVNKQYTDIQEDDIRFLMNLPLTIGKIDGDLVQLVYGPYGFYLKYRGMNVSMVKKTTKTMILQKSFDLDAIKKMIDYHTNTKKKSS